MKKPAFGEHENLLFNLRDSDFVYEFVFVYLIETDLFVNRETPRSQENMQEIKNLSVSVMERVGET